MFFKFLDQSDLNITLAGYFNRIFKSFLNKKRD